MAENKNENDTLSFYTVGTKAWFKDEEEGFVTGTLSNRLVDDNNVELTFIIENSSETKVIKTTIKELEKTKYSVLPPLRNPPVLEGIDDLTLLSHLHEPAVLHNVKIRYNQQQIYTYSGIVLIALNPFQSLPIYTPDIMRAYSGKRRGELEPHLFAIAEEAYRNMLRENKNQSIIVSGESGAGKTQSAKYIMRYFATIDMIDKSFPGSQDDLSMLNNGMSEVEEAVLATNPIMEAFGNAKTSRNDNSSRFGKYIEIQFLKDKVGNVKIAGAQTRTYLLERSRLVFQPPTERNYHIFYQLCAGCPAAERKDLGITTFDQYNYLNQGGDGTIPGVDDEAEFSITQRALSATGIPVSLQWSVFRVCAALLHIGNIEVKASRNGDSVVQETDPAVVTATKLLGIPASDFCKWIMKKQIKARTEVINTNLNQNDAIVGRDSIAKFLYSQLFEWLVQMINKNLALTEIPNEETLSFIGVLDIYGFEHFDKNSFEQFCINYSNEKLQQEFNQHVFKLEQDEYVTEKIEWSFIDFNDNQPCIDLIESRFGILALLDEECKLPSGSDSSLITKLYNNFNNDKYKDFFKKPRFSGDSFTIAHYALDVTYSIEGFLEKNKDTVSDEQLNLLMNSTNEFVKEIVKLERVEALSPEQTRRSIHAGRPNTTPQKKTLGSIFKRSLIELMNTIRSTDVHYIRCIKPNQAKQAFIFEPIMVLSQLRACGVLETIRISCAGYPTRWTFQEFVDRYYLLLKSEDWNSKDYKTMTEKIVESTITNPDKYQFGITKVFFRTGMLAYLEKIRSDRLNKAITMVQKNIKCFIYKKRYINIREAALTVQAAVRIKLAQQLLKTKREECAAITIQKNVRAYASRKRYNELRDAAITIQSAIRLIKAKNEYIELKRNSAAIKIQKVFRGERTRKFYKQQISSIVYVQSCIRRISALNQYRELKKEAKSITHIKQVNYQLENKVFELSQSLTEKENLNKEYIDKISWLESQISIWKEKFERLDTRTKDFGEQANEEQANLERELNNYKEKTSRLEKECSDANDTINVKNSEIAKLKDIIEKQKQEIKKVNDDLYLVSTKSSQYANEASEVALLRKENNKLKDQLAKAHKFRADSNNEPQTLEENYRRKSLSKGRSNLHITSSLEKRRNSVITPQSSDVVLLKEKKNSFFSNSINELSSNDDINDEVIKAENEPKKDEVEDEEEKKKLEAEALENECTLKMLEDPSLEKEIIDGLILSLEVPKPTENIEPKSIFYPSHIIGIFIKRMLDNGLLTRVQNITAKVIQSIQNVVLKNVDNNVSAFWLSNSYELLCVIKTIMVRDPYSNAENSNSYIIMEKISNDIELLIVEIYFTWLKELKKELNVMIVPAVIESQCLKEYIIRNDGIWNRIKGTTNPQYSIEQLLTYLSKISKLLKLYYMEESIATQILSHLVKLIGINSFNHLIMRKNFCSWKRGVQIQYNVNQIEVWCDTHQVQEGFMHMEYLIQAAKLLQLSKISVEEIVNAAEICYLLNTTQIKKFLSIYQPLEYENPVPTEVIQSIGSQDIKNQTENLLLNIEDNEFNNPTPILINDYEQVELPRDNDLFLIKCLLEI
ncbi:myosin-2 [Piromyces finnis]|uniref:Myosin-2 n=1 Tax=Piromyces finnis TaxID=1754191 RepID=A0A1Y1VH11_9FUNG|nr:myosin-2 [Piromyces finnis]|eukprot:ORX55940.1 myosin-2 [Piromyces finnis]